MNDYQYQHGNLILFYLLILISVCVCEYKIVSIAGKVLQYALQEMDNDRVNYLLEWEARKISAILKSDIRSETTEARTGNRRLLSSFSPSSNG